MNKFENRDCMQGMKEFSDNHFDLAIVDPPYGLKVSKQDNTKRGKLGSHYKKKNWDLNKPTNEYWAQLFRVSKNQIVWGGNYFVENLNSSPCWIVWDKRSVGNTADCELAWASFNTAVKRFSFLWEGFWQENMKNKEYRIHPTQKPVALYIWLLKNYAKKGDLILDTHVGSASSLIACEKMGFDYVGYEKDIDYYNDAQQRLTEFRMQTDLFRD